MKKFRTSDMGLAATLGTQGYQLVGIEDETERRKFFVFNDDSDDAYKVEEKFRMDTIKVSPQLFLFQLKGLKMALGARRYNRN